MTETNYDRPTAENFARAGVTFLSLAGQHVDVARNAVLGLQSIIQLVEHDGTAELSQDIVSELMSAASRALPALVQGVSGVVSVERVGLGIIAAASLITLFGQSGTSAVAVTSQPMVLDQIDHVALLAAELEVALRRKSIAARGDPFRQAGLARQLASITKTDCKSLH